MKRIHIALLILSAAIICAPCFALAQNSAGAEIFRQEGIASWYGPEFDGRPTASGEIFNSSHYTAAHPSLPFGTVLTVTNQHNNKKVTVKVNDRGPFVSARIIDLSRAAAEELDMLTTGTAPVLVESVAAVAQPGQTKTSVDPDAQRTLPPQVQQPVVQQPAASVPAPPAPVPPPQTVTQMQPAPAMPPPAQDSRELQSAPAVSAAAVQPIRAPAPVRYGPAVLIPPVAPASEKTYRLQAGSYQVARNAVEAFDKLKTAGLNPAYERFENYFRVVLAGIRGNDVYAVLEKLGNAGFREALIREER